MWCNLAFERCAPQDLCNCAAVCKSWQQAAADADVWRMLCNQHFERHYVPDSIKARLSSDSHPVVVLREALKDLKRTALFAEELHAFTWNFRFKEMAGDAWTSRDPWWHGQAPVKVWFRLGGAVERSDSLAVQIQWRWGTSTTGEPGSGDQPATSMKCSVNGRDVPTYIFGRHPLHGGFLMHSCWALYTAFPMPAKGMDPYLTDEALDLSADAQLDEVQEYNFGHSAVRLGSTTLHLPAELATLLHNRPRAEQLQILQAILEAQADESDDDAPIRTAGYR
eukprot:TRINITY_DN78183_c0_g1_i1.p1 TRINITY_DN78183_c0_g1~~TRINITY_DN78183_c0_g1_i1.p1  ORF type:complete len:289 (+),score=40.00 TRINITY_DN78183_c0_g1_i1:30-869(+)